jgi:EpsI family protein
MNRYTTFLPALALLSGVVLVSGIREQYRMPPVAPMSSIPTTINGAGSYEQPVPEEEKKIAGMSDYTRRVYGKDTLNYDFSLYVGYYDRQVQGKSIHSPKNCLPGGGWETMVNERIPLPGTIPGTINRVIIGNNGVRGLVYYWYQGRGRVESNEFRVKWDLLRDAALYGRTEEALVRIIVPIQPGPKGTMPSADDEYVKAADVIARRAAEQIAPMVAKVLPTFPGA